MSGKEFQRDRFDEKDGTHGQKLHLLQERAGGENLR